MDKWLNTNLYCTNPGCSHAREPHPIQGVSHPGSLNEPPDAEPELCPTCGHFTDTTPLFPQDTEGISEPN